MANGSKTSKKYINHLILNNTSLNLNFSKMMRMCNVVNERQRKKYFNGNNSQNFNQISIIYSVNQKHNRTKLSSKGAYNRMGIGIINKKLSRWDIITDMYSINKFSIGNVRVGVGG